MTATDAPYVNVLDPQFYVDPWDAYRWLRDKAPCFWDPVQRIWGVSRYDDVDGDREARRALLVVSGSRPQIDQRTIRR